VPPPGVEPGTMTFQRGRVVRFRGHAPTPIRSGLDYYAPPAGPGQALALPLCRQRKGCCLLNGALVDLPERGFGGGARVNRKLYR
jgi:hypothetical protein